MGEYDGEARSFVSAGWILFWSFLAMLVIVTVVGWKLNWWFAEENSAHQDTINSSSASRQESLRQAITQDGQGIDQINVTLAGLAQDDPQRVPLEGQRKGLLNQLCGAAAGLNAPVPDPDQDAFIGRNCTAGHASSAPTYT